MEVSFKDIHKDVIEACKNGDKLSQFRLYKLYAKAMYNTCYRFVNNKEQAEDLLQDAFTEAFLNLDSFGYKSSFGAWLKRIVINKCINELKKKRPVLVLDDEVQNKMPQIYDEKDEYDYATDVKKIIDAMNKLADGYRVILSLYLFEGYDHTEISQILNISESTSKSQYMRAKNKIKELLKTK